MSDKNISINKTKSGNSPFEDHSYLNAKEKSNKGSSMIIKINENNLEKKEKDDLIEGLKESSIKIYYNLPKLKIEYKEIKIGGKTYEHIKELEKNEIPIFEPLNRFIKFFKEIEEKIETEYNKKYEFLLELYITGDKNKNSCNLECKYLLKISGKTFQYKDYDIINNGISTGFEFLLYDLNHFSDKVIDLKMI